MATVTEQRETAVSRLRQTTYGQRLPSLTSLRWLAATLVFLHHTRPFLVGSSAMGIYDRVGAQGAAGVSFFFILSGFVLAWAYRRGDTIRAFWRRRVARIVPAYWAACLIALVLRVVIDGKTSHGQIATTLFPFTLLQSWVPSGKVYFGGNSVSWSLSDEVLFYALFPVLIVAIVRLGRTRLLQLAAVLAGAAILLPLVLRPTSDPGVRQWAAYIFPPTRLLEFAIGIMLCVALRSGVRLRVPPLAALALAAAAYLAGGFAPSYAQWVAVTLIPFALLIFACAEADLTRPAGRGLLQRPALIRLGQWSFCFYLVHQMVTGRFQPYLTDHPHLALSTRYGLIAAAYVLAIGAAYLLFRFVEYPLERRIRHGSTATPPDEARR
jgi:peptidoglycan/LPS O-acetylase OafA/YrhL